MKRRFIFLLYRLALTAALPLVLLYLVWRAARRPGYGQTLRERLGRLPASFSKTPSGSVWLHAISVGEVNSAAVLVAAIRREMPGVPVYVSVGTLAGRELAAQRLSRITDGIFYAPLDYAFCVRAVLGAIRPALVIVMETEIWPNLWRESRRAGARLLVVNARISDKALPQYQRLRAFFGAVLGEADTILAQTAENVARYRLLGCAGDVRHGGNLKYDFRPGPVPAPLSEWIARTAPARTWIAASTMPPAAPDDPDEDEAVLDAFEKLAASHPRLLMILVPRRPERFDTAAAEMSRRGIRFTRRSALAGLTLPGVLLLDSVGELASLFQLADVVFMGGTLVQRGGHNILEPAYFAKPVISGPNLQNFAEIAADFRAADALVEITRATELSDAVASLLTDDARRARLGAISAELARSRTGATAIAMAEVRRLYDLGVPRPIPRLWEWPLEPLSWLWRAGAALDRRRKLVLRKRLPKPVISIGGIGMGGAGKTPFAVLAARMLRDAGYAPAFLTRGYGRRSSEPVILAPGADAPAERTGDEARILLHSGLGPVGIGADRHANGARISAAEVFLLDDGFQHHALHRDLDIVLIDCLDPFAGGRLFPAGRLREPLEQLRRAGLFVLTRAVPGRAYAGIRAELRRWNPDAPVLVSRVEPAAWVDAATGEEMPLDAIPAGARAFCGLGNPAAFRQSLDRVAPGIPLSEFADHHRYTRAELAALAEGAPLLLTTEKDVMNLPSDWARATGTPIHWLKIEIVLDEPGKLAERLSAAAARASS